jgi:hypothetical protein
MNIDAATQERPDVSAEERASLLRMKRTLKLRWIGMKSEAGQVQGAVQQRPPLGPPRLRPQRTDAQEYE